MKFKKILAGIVRHGSLILGLFFITVSILHEYNPGMMFLTNNTSLLLLRLFCLLGIAGFFIREPRKKAETDS